MHDARAAVGRSVLHGHLLQRRQDADLDGRVLQARVAEGTRHGRPVGSQGAGNVVLRSLRVLEGPPWRICRSVPVASDFLLIITPLSKVAKLTPNVSRESYDGAI